MSDINQCFISYRHPGDREADKFVLRFKEVLTSQLALLKPNPRVFLDEERLGVGDFFKPALAQELCRSACMVMFYSPMHFEPGHPYCGLEYQAMLQLEHERHAQLAEPNNCSLIFPVVLRGYQHLPKEIKDERLCENFEVDVVCADDFKKRKCQTRIRDLAQKIFNRCLVLEEAKVFSNRDCGKYLFPDADSITDWLKSVAPVPQFPGH